MDVETKKRVGELDVSLLPGYLSDKLPPAEILIQGVKKLEPEEIARKIQQFDQDLCTQVFLSELKRVLPSPEQVCKTMVNLTVTNQCSRWASSMCIAMQIQKS